ncbi:protein NO VEIN domain-containing protein [Microbacterium sp. NPDC055357]
MNYVELDEPITREMVISRRPEIASTFRDIEQRSTGSIYPPFQLWDNGDVRAAQGYLFKFPAALAHWVFGPPSLATEPGATPRSPTGAGKSQGYMSDAAKRVALEKHAVALAIDHYRSEGASHIEERGKPFDLLVVLDGVERHVEVKGSIGIGVEHVQLTQGEVDHANRHQPTDLFVVDEIHASYAADGIVVTKGGKVRIWSGWTPSERSLRPTHLRYTLPSGD